jgi:hypothetical protein
MDKLIPSIASGIFLSLLGVGVQADTIVLDFEGVGNTAQVLDFYNGGTDSLGNSGVNYGASFGSASLGLIDSDSGGTGNFANEPSAKTVMYFLTGTLILNYAAGFDTGFSFFYSSDTAAIVKVYDGLNGSGNLLGSINLTAQFSDNACVGDPSGSFCTWTAAGVNFGGIAKSIDFGGATGNTAYDNVTFGSATPGAVPLPTAAWLFGSALLGLGVVKRKKA